MATLAELRASVARDLRDTSMRTFISAVIDDLINAGVEEVSRVYPLEKVVVVTPVANTYDYDLSAYRFLQIFRVEQQRSDLFHATMPQSDHEDENNGWEFFAGFLRFPRRAWVGLTVATDSFRVWGYSTRARLLTDAQVAELDDAAEWAVRAFAKAEAFGLMQSDRALYKQWQAMSQNTDLSPNQINQMVALSSGEWNRQRNHLRRLRRV